MAEGDETYGGERARSGRSEGDLLAERRARRAAESGELALTRRAEAAEATVQTLERHVASLQQRLRDAEDEQRLAAELLEVEKAAALEREHELRRVKQREYAEQQLRVEAEERMVGSDRESRAELERLAGRLSASEQDAAEMADALEAMQRQLAEAEQVAVSERALLLTELRSAERELQARVGTLELRAVELQQGLADERAARERSELQLEGMREGHSQMARLLGDMRGLLERLAIAAAAPRASAPPPRTLPPSLTTTAHLASAEPPPAKPTPTTRTPAPEARGAEMADALAAAVERLRERAQAVPEVKAAPVVRPSHKHSMSLIGRLRLRRKQRRSR
jgi:hypothetical protein